MVRRGIASSQDDARVMIESGEITVAGAPATKAGHLVAAGEPIERLPPPSRFVSRGGEKLAAALTQFKIDVADKRAIDVGASTGGFTHCLLQHGAREVVAIDVGYGQLHEHLRADDRVHNFERTNIRGLDVTAIGGPAPLVVADLSFISLRQVAGDLERLGTSNAEWVLLVKPQFEAERQEADRGRGVIRDSSVWRRVLQEVKTAFMSYGLNLEGAMVSPITGKDGNTEFLVKLTRRDIMVSDQQLEEAVITAQRCYTASTSIQTAEV